MPRPHPTQDLIAGRFRLITEIGRGGMGVVWRAEDVKVGRIVALKVILDEAPDGKTQTRFLAEAKAAASIAGPNVAEVLDFGVDRGTPYLAMELLSGESLATRLTRDARLSGRSTVQVVSGAAAALDRAHALGIVHRDLKPSNLHLTLAASGVELVKVLDFGIAKFLADGASEGVTTPGAIMGTTSYMSPEQARGSSEIDHRSDLWSLAILAFQCATGQLPIQRPSMVELILAIVRAPIRAPSSIDPTLPPAFDAWFARATRRTPSERFGSAGELARELARAFEHA